MGAFTIVHLSHQMLAQGRETFPERTAPARQQRFQRLDADLHDLRGFDIAQFFIMAERDRHFLPCGQRIERLINGEAPLARKHRLILPVGAVELLQFRRATSTLTRSLAALSDRASADLEALDAWLTKLHPPLQHSVRRRIEGERVALPMPVLTPYLVSLLVMLGLLGTFVGLVETLKGVVGAHFET